MLKKNYKIIKESKINLQITLQYIYRRSLVKREIRTNKNYIILEIPSTNKNFLAYL